MKMSKLGKAVLEAFRINDEANDLYSDSSISQENFGVEELVSLDVKLESQRMTFKVHLN